MQALPYGSTSEFLRNGIYRPTLVGVHDILCDSIIPFTCAACKVLPPEVIGEDLCSQDFRRCKECNATKYRWVTRKNLPKRILEKVERKDNLILLTFTLPNFVFNSAPTDAELNYCRQTTVGAIRRLLRSKRDRNKQERNGVRHLLKGWFYAYEFTRRHEPCDHVTELGAECECGGGVHVINAHVHMIAERRFWFYHKWLKDQAVKAGLGEVVNIRHVGKTPERAVAYIVKYMLKDHESGKGTTRYYETGGSFRKSRQS